MKVKMGDSMTKQGHKRLWLSLVMIALAILMIAAAFAIESYRQRTVDVVAFSRDMTVGDKITDVNKDLVAYPLTVSNYESLGNQTYTNAKGEKVTGQVYVKWSDRDKLLNNSVTVFSKQNEPVSIGTVTATAVDRNPWYSKVNEGDEFYTMEFKSTDVDTRLLLPGSLLRLRLVANVSADQAAAIKASIEKEQSSQSSSSSASSGSGALTEGINSVALNGINTPKDDRASTVPVADIAFDKVRVVDMLNSNNESIFDIYTEISRMTASDRAVYFKKNITGGNSDFIKRITPKSLVFVFNKSQATLVAELENNKTAVQKYTILKEKEQDPLYGKFKSVSDEINAAIASAVAD